MERMDLLTMITMMIFHCIPFSPYTTHSSLCLQKFVHSILAVMFLLIAVSDVLGETGKMKINDREL